MFNGFTKQISRLSRTWLAAAIVTLMVLMTGCGIILDDQPTNSDSSEHSASGTGHTDTKQQPAKSSGNANPQKQSSGSLTSFKDVSDYIREHHELPANFITKKEAEKLGWVPSKGNLHQVAPGKSIGGDRFGNREGLLPKAKNRIWYEADINYKKGTRGADRILFSNDGLIYMTTDHYKSFTDITKEGSVPK